MDSSPESYGFVADRYYGMQSGLVRIIIFASHYPWYMACFTLLHPSFVSK